MEIEKKLANIVQLLVQSGSKKLLSLKIHDQLVGRISTLSFILGESKVDSLSDILKKLVNDLLSELETNLQALNQTESSFLSRIYNLLPGSHSKKIEALIPKLLELTDKLAMNISLHKYIESSVNTKRKAERPAEEGEDQNSDELKAASQGYKKVKVNNEDSIDIESSPIGATSTTKIVNKTPSGHSFSIKMICCKELDPYVPTHSRVKYPLVNAKGTEASLTLRREEFASLPKDAVLRLSKEHVTVTAKGLADNVSFQITDKSANGVYFMGNRIEGSYLQRVPERLKKEAPYNIRNGDIFGVLMNKDTQNKEMLLGFEFIEG